MCIMKCEHMGHNGICAKAGRPCAALVEGSGRLQPLCASFSPDDIDHVVHEAGMTKTAAWSDVRDKGMAIAAYGGVEIYRDDAQEIGAYVMSGVVDGLFPVADGGPYEVILSKRSWQNGNAGGWVQAFFCDCTWGQYHSGRPGAGYSGRFCSHAYAALLESNARANGRFMSDRTASRGGTPWHAGNFYMGCSAEFEPVERPEREPDFTSDSGSEYWYSDEGVVRGSDHWGANIGTSTWRMRGDEHLSAWFDRKGRRHGFCRWEDFETNADLPKLEVVEGGGSFFVDVTPDMLWDDEVHYGGKSAEWDTKDGATICLEDDIMAKRAAMSDWQFIDGCYERHLGDLHAYAYEDGRYYIYDGEGELVDEGEVDGHADYAMEVADEVLERESRTASTRSKVADLGMWDERLDGLFKSIPDWHLNCAAIPSDLGGDMGIIWMWNVMQDDGYVVADGKAWSKEEAMSDCDAAVQRYIDSVPLGLDDDDIDHIYVMVNGSKKAGIEGEDFALVGGEPVYPGDTIIDEGGYEYKIISFTDHDYGYGLQLEFTETGDVFDTWDDDAYEVELDKCRLAGAKMAAHQVYITTSEGSQVAEFDGKLVPETWGEFMDQNIFGWSYNFEDGEAERLDIYDPEYDEVHPWALLDFIEEKTRDASKVAYIQPTVLQAGSRERQTLQELADKLNDTPGHCTFEVEDVYFDYGQDWMWTTIVARNPSKSFGDSWQILSPRQFSELCETGSIEGVYQDMLHDEYSYLYGWELDASKVAYDHATVERFVERALDIKANQFSNWRSLADIREDENVLNLIDQFGMTADDYAEGTRRVWEEIALGASRKVAWGERGVYVVSFKSGGMGERRFTKFIDGNLPEAVAREIAEDYANGTGCEVMAMEFDENPDWDFIDKYVILARRGTARKASAGWERVDGYYVKEFDDKCKAEVYDEGDWFIVFDGEIVESGIAPGLLSAQDAAEAWHEANCPGAESAKKADYIELHPYGRNGEEAYETSLCDGRFWVNITPERDGSWYATCMEDSDEFEFGEGWTPQDALQNLVNNMKAQGVTVTARSASRKVSDRWGYDNFEGQWYGPAGGHDSRRDYGDGYFAEIWGGYDEDGYPTSTYGWWFLRENGTPKGETVDSGKAYNKGEAMDMCDELHEKLTGVQASRKTAQDGAIQVGDTVDFFQDLLYEGGGLDVYQGTYEVLDIDGMSWRDSDGARSESTTYELKDPATGETFKVTTGWGKTIKKHAVRHKGAERYEIEDMFDSSRNLECETYVDDDGLWHWKVDDLDEGIVAVTDEMAGVGPYENEDDALEDMAAVCDAKLKTSKAAAWERFDENVSDELEFLEPSEILELYGAYTDESYICSHDGIMGVVSHHVGQVDEWWTWDTYYGNMLAGLDCGTCQTKDEAIAACEKSLADNGARLSARKPKTAQVEEIEIYDTLGGWDGWAEVYQNRDGVWGWEAFKYYNDSDFAGVRVDDFFGFDTKDEAIDDLWGQDRYIEASCKAALDDEDWYKADKAQPGKVLVTRLNDGTVVREEPIVRREFDSELNEECVYVIGQNGAELKVPLSDIAKMKQLVIKDASRKTAQEVDEGAVRDTINYIKQNDLRPNDYPSDYDMVFDYAVSLISVYGVSNDDADWWVDEVTDEAMFQVQHGAGRKSAQDIDPTAGENWKLFYDTFVKYVDGGVSEGGYECAVFDTMGVWCWKVVGPTYDEIGHGECDTCEEAQAACDSALAAVGVTAGKKRAAKFPSGLDDFEYSDYWEVYHYDTGDAEIQLFDRGDGTWWADVSWNDGASVTNEQLGDDCSTAEEAISWAKKTLESPTRGAKKASPSSVEWEYGIGGTYHGKVDGGARAKIICMNESGGLEYDRYAWKVYKNRDDEWSNNEAMAGEADSLEEAMSFVEEALVACGFEASKQADVDDWTNEYGDTWTKIYSDGYIGTVSNVPWEDMEMGASFVLAEGGALEKTVAAGDAEDTLEARAMCDEAHDRAAYGSRTATAKTATRQFTYAEMKELEDEIEGTELKNADRFKDGGAAYYSSL